MAIYEAEREWSPEQLGYVRHFLLHKESDVKDLPECCVGSKATVCETDNEYVCTVNGWKLKSECEEMLKGVVDEIARKQISDLNKRVDDEIGAMVALADEIIADQDAFIGGSA